MIKNNEIVNISAMNAKESDKFSEVISDTYKELITKRPEKPLHHFIYYMLSRLPEDMRAKDPKVNEFFTNYRDKHLHGVKEIKE